MMIKISKDNLFFFSRLWPAFFLIIHLGMIYGCILSNFLLFYIAYAFFAVMQIAVLKMWRFLLLKDVFIDRATDRVYFKELNGAQLEFMLYQVSEQRTYKGITKVSIKDNDSTLKFYYIARTKNDRNLLGR